MGASFPPNLVFPPNVAYRLPGQPMLCCNSNNAIYTSTSGADSSNNSMNTRRTCTAPALTAISDIVLGFPGFGMVLASLGEVSIPNGFTVTASIEYPLGTTPRQVFFNGANSGTIVPGRTLLKTDPFPGFIPAGAQFAVKTFITWTGTMWLCSGASSTLLPPASAGLPGDWTNRGVGLPDLTLTTTVQTQTTSNSGYSPIIYAMPVTRVPALCAIGDSWFAGSNDVHDPISGGTTIIRAFQNQIPIAASCLGGFNMVEYVQRQEGQSAVFRNACTHMIMELGINDVDANGQTLATYQANYQTTINPLLARQVKVWGWTLSPHTTSTDRWITTANQTPVASESIRQGVNSWLRGNWQGLGLAGLIDADLAVDPPNLGAWACDVGFTTQCTSPGAGFATIVGGVVTAVSSSSIPWQVGIPVGVGYPASSTLAWTSYPYPGQTGSGAFGTFTTNASGNITGWTVTSGGSNYSKPPMINILGAFTFDGLHGYPRAWNEIIYQTGLSAGMLVF
jgi:hypothetical protein